VEESSESPESVLELAQACEHYVARALGFQLDYSIETLPVLDQYVDDVRASVMERPDLMLLLSNAVGAYFGEVICRTLGGFWRPSPNVVDWQVCLTPVFVWLNPIGVASDALAGHPDHDGPSSQIRVSPEDREFVRARLGRLAEVDEEQYCRLSTRMEVLQIVVEELAHRMEERGYGGTTFDLSDYEAEQLPPAH
jgi:hypothetical protein